MTIALGASTQQRLRSIFKPLNQFHDYVVWIRNHDMSKQLYMSDNYEHIWQRDGSILYKLPLMWLEYLAEENKLESMKLLQDRHLAEYLDEHKNIVLYQVATPSNENVFLLDRCYRCVDRQQNHYIIGFSKTISPDLWHSYLKNIPVILTDDCQRLYLHLFKLLKKEFGIVRMTQELSLVNDPIGLCKQYSLSKRELECLIVVCQGKTNKAVARELLISPRTIETHLVNIMRKTQCQNKIELISRFSKYFYNN